MINSSATHQLKHNSAGEHHQHSSTTSTSGRGLVNMIPKHLKTSAVVHLVIVVCLLTSVAVITRSIVGRSIGDVISASGLLQQQEPLNLNASSLTQINCSAAIQDEARKQNSSSTSSSSSQVDELGDDDQEQGVIRGYILSSKLDRRYNSSMKVLSELNIQLVERMVPFPWDSERVDKALERYAGSRKFNTERFLRSYSNQLTFVNYFRKFVNDKSAKLDSWRFFFENDIALHPAVTAHEARAAILEGMQLAAADGMLYLGICGPRGCEAKTQLASTGLEASRCSGCCSHAFGFTKWKAAAFLSVLPKFQIRPKVNGIHIDLVFMHYSNLVHKNWYLGSSLKSPVKSVRDHFGILYQDRNHFNSTITPPS
jgi:hypothetical protein